MAIEVIFNIILGLLIVFYLYEAMQLPNIDDTVDVLGASGFPQIIGVLALLVLLFIPINTIRENKAVQISLFNLRLPEGRLLLLKSNFCRSTHDLPVPQGGDLCIDV